MMIHINLPQKVVGCSSLEQPRIYGEEFDLCSTCCRYTCRMRYPCQTHCILTLAVQFQAAWASTQVARHQSSVGWTGLYSLSSYSSWQTLKSQPCSGFFLPRSRACWDGVILARMTRMNSLFLRKILCMYVRALVWKSEFEIQYRKISDATISMMMR